MFALHNFSYSSAHFFRSCAGILVPSNFCANFYRQSLGIACTSILSPILEAAVRCNPLPGHRQFVTFVNPSPHNGVYVFAAIALLLQKTRPDIPLLVVESRADSEWLLYACPSLAESTNAYRMSTTQDPREFYQVTKIMLIPSVWQESFGRVAAESMMNGIPVIASNRGALPETIGSASETLELPAEITPPAVQIA